MARITVRRTGGDRYPWEVRCSACQGERLHFTGFGVVVVNSRGVGNRLWWLAMLAAWAHLAAHQNERPQ